MRNAALVVLVGAVLGLNGCGGSASGGSAGAGGATGGSAGGGAGSTGNAGATGSAGTSGTGGSAGGDAGVTASGGSAGGAGTSGNAGSGGAGGGGAGSVGHGGGSAGTSGGGATGAGGAAVCGDATGLGSGATCNSIVATGACVTSTLSASTVPTPAGGAFVAGTYNLVSQIDYGAADAGFVSQTGRQTVVLSNVTATSFTLDQIQTSGTIVARTEGTVAVSGMTATFARTCPPPKDGGTDSGDSAQFTATSNSITLFQENNGLVEVSVYTKTP